MLMIINAKKNTSCDFALLVEFPQTVSAGDKEAESF